MSLPEQFAEAAEKAKELRKQAYGEEETNRDSEGVVGKVEGAEEEQIEQVEQVEQPLEQTPDILDTAKLTEEIEGYKARYQTLKGKYDKEVPRLHQQVKEQTARLEQLEQLLAAMQSAPKQQETEQDWGITPDERETWGEDLLSVVEKQARSIVKQQRAEYEARIAKLEEQLNAVSGSTNQVAKQVEDASWDRFLDTVRTQIPNFEQVDRSQEFLDWLSIPDSFSGIERQELLNKAARERDIERTVRIFNTYLKEKGIVREPQADAKRVSDLEKQIAPGRGVGSPTSNTSGSKREYSRGDIAEFYKAVASGEYKGRDAERRKIEYDIIAAGKEGRIR